MSDPGAERRAGDPGRRPPANILVNVSANVIGQAVTVLAGVLCVPVYLRLLGAEAIGLIGFSLGLQAVIRMLDMGLASAVVRQMARLGGQQGRHNELAGFYATFERLFAGAAVLIAAVTLALSPLIASRWLQGARLSNSSVTFAVAAISVQAALFFMGTLYHGALMGLERQVLFNRLRVVETCFSQFGAVLLLTFWMPRVEVLFGWQLAVSLVAVVVYGRATRGAMPVAASGSGRFAMEHVRGVWKYAAGMAGITATGTVLVNMDKVLLGRWLTLETFGHYTLAFYAASLVGGLLVAPVFNALFPRSCALVERGDEAGERRLYHLALQVLTALVLPVAAVLWAYAPLVLQLWIHDRAAVQAAAAVLPLLVAGVALNTLMVPAYMIQLAHAWTTLGFKLNLALVALFAPLLYLLTVHGGLAGAAANFALMQGTYLLIGMPLTHRRLLPDALKEVVLRDLLPGIAVCVAAAAALTATRGLLDTAGPLPRVAAIGGAWAALAVATALVSARVRPLLRRALSGRGDLDAMLA